MSFEIVGSVTQDEVPKPDKRKGRPGVFSAIAERAVEDHRQGRVTVVKVPNEEELKRLRNNISHVLHQYGLAARPIVVKQGEEYRVFLELVDYTPAPRAPRQPIGNGQLLEPLPVEF